MENIVVPMTFSKSTPGTHVYAEAEQGTPIRTIYIKKSDLPSPPPQYIVVTVEDASGD